MLSTNHLFSYIERAYRLCSKTCSEPACCLLPSMAASLLKWNMWLDRFGSNSVHHTNSLRLELLLIPIKLDISMLQWQQMYTQILIRILIYIITKYWVNTIFTQYFFFNWIIWISLTSFYFLHMLHCITCLHSLWKKKHAILAFIYVCIYVFI